MRSVCHIKFHRFLAGVIALSSAFFLSSGLADNQLGNEPVRIGVLYWSMSIPGQVAMRKGLEAEAKKINSESRNNKLPAVELLVSVAGDGQDGIERQIRQMHDLIKLRPDVIIVQPTDNAALAEPLREANRLNIPVVAYDQYISGGELAAYITSDNRQAGYLNRSEERRVGKECRSRGSPDH